MNIKGISDHREDQDREDQMLDLKESNSHTEDLEERTQMPVDINVVLDQDVGHDEDKCDQILVAVNIKASTDNGEGQNKEAHIPVNIQAISDNGEGQGRASMDTKTSSDYGSQVPPNVIWLG